MHSTATACTGSCRTIAGVGVSVACADGEVRCLNQKATPTGRSTSTSRLRLSLGGGGGPGPRGRAGGARIDGGSKRRGHDRHCSPDEYVGVQPREKHGHQVPVVPMVHIKFGLQVNDPAWSEQQAGEEVRWEVDIGFAAGEMLP
jgi:hypothetical protein